MYVYFSIDLAKTREIRRMTTNQNNLQFGTDGAINMYVMLCYLLSCVIETNKFDNMCIGRRVVMSCVAVTPQMMLKEERSFRKTTTFCLYFLLSHPQRQQLVRN